MQKFRINQTVYFIRSHSSVVTAKIVNYHGGMYTIRFESGGGMRISESRLFATEEQAKATLKPKVIKPSEDSTQHRHSNWKPYW